MTSILLWSSCVNKGAHTYTVHIKLQKASRKVRGTRRGREDRKKEIAKLNFNK